MSLPINNQHPQVGQTPPPSDEAKPIAQPQVSRGGSFVASTEPVPTQAPVPRPSNQLPIEQGTSFSAEDITRMIDDATVATRESMANNAMAHAAVSTAQQGAVVLHHPENEYLAMPPPEPTTLSLMAQVDELIDAVKIFNQSLPYGTQPQNRLAEDVKIFNESLPHVAQPQVRLEPIEPKKPPVEPIRPPEEKVESSLDRLARERAEEKFNTEPRYAKQRELEKTTHPNIRQTMIREMLSAIKDEIVAEQYREIASKNPYRPFLTKMQDDLKNFSNLSKKDQVRVVTEGIKLLKICASSKNESFIAEDGTLTRLTDLEKLMGNPAAQKAINSTQETRVGYLQALLQIRYSSTVENARNISEFMSQHHQQLTTMTREISQDQAAFIQAHPNINGGDLKQLGINAEKELVDEVIAQLKKDPETVIFLQEGTALYNTLNFLDRLATVPANTHTFLKDTLTNPREIVKNQVKKYESIIKDHSKSIKENSARMKEIYNEIKQDPAQADNAAKIKNFFTAPDDVARSLALKKLISSENPRISQLAKEIKVRMDSKSKYSKYLNEIKEGFENKDYSRIASNVIEIEKDQMRFAEYTANKDCLVETIQRYLNGKLQQVPLGSPTHVAIQKHLAVLKEAKSGESLDFQKFSTLLDAMKRDGFPPT